MTLLLRHTRYQFLETVRVPVGMIGTLALPALFMLMFFVPNDAIRSEPSAAVMAAGQLSLFAIGSAYAYNIGIGVATDRQSSWQSYVRRLPVGPAAVLGGRLLNAVIGGVMSLVPVVLVAALCTAATAPIDRLALAFPALLVAALPYAFTGLAVGYSLSVAAAIPIIQLLVLPTAFVGGLFMPPDGFPSWLDAISHALPTRAGRELVLGALSGRAPGAWVVWTLLVWTVGLAALAVFAHRRDEGRRFR